MRNWSAALGFLTGIVLISTKVMLAEDLWWPFIIPEYVTAIMLIIGSGIFLIKPNYRLLCAGWGAALLQSWSTLAHHLMETESFAAAGPVEYALLVLVVVSIGGLLLGMAPATERTG